jgi:hypothetical protein
MWMTENGILRRKNQLGVPSTLTFGIASKKSVPTATIQLKPFAWVTKTV